MFAIPTQDAFAHGTKCMHHRSVVLYCTAVLEMLYLIRAYTRTHTQTHTAHNHELLGIFKTATPHHSTICICPTEHQSTSTLVPVYLHTCASLTPHLYQSNSTLAPVYLHTCASLTPHLYQSNSTLAPVYLHTCASLTPHLYQSNSTLAPV